MVKIGNIELGDFPILLAPMEDVSDPPFRALCKQEGADVMYTEFVSSEGLIRDAVKSIKKLDIFEYERPIAIQIFGGNIESMIETTRICVEAKPDFIDINYGCPVKKVVSKEAGSGILKNIPKMIEMTAQIVKSTNLPVTVKTRLGWDESSKHIVEVAERLQDVGIQALSIHGRTKKQMYKGEADWTLIGEVKNNPRMTIPIFGNGDVKTPEIAKEKKDRYGIDGVMIGRAAIGYPWIFNEIKHFLKTGEHLPRPDIHTRVKAVRDHLDFSLRWKSEGQAVVEMRKHYSNYFRELPGFKDHRMKLVKTMDPQEIRDILNTVEKIYDGYEPWIK